MTKILRGCHRRSEWIQERLANKIKEGMNWFFLTFIMAICAGGIVSEKKGAIYGITVWTVFWSLVLLVRFVDWLGI